MSKVAILMGSPLREGNTAALCRAYAAGTQARGHAVDTINVVDYKIAPCTGCNACYTEAHRCVQKDDMQNVFDRLAEANVIVIATPLYFYSVSAQIKAVIDRLHNPARSTFKADRLALISVGADTDKSAFAALETMYSSVLNYFSLEDAGRLLVCGAQQPDALRGRDEIALARKMGEALDMLPSEKTAERLLREAEPLNPGPWVEHSRVAARCARSIAAAAGLDPRRAYVSGLLHDIGRKCGKTGMRHMLDGYKYLMEMGYDDAARICMTHSYQIKDREAVLGVFDMSPEDLAWTDTYISGCEFDDYDLLIQLCDSISMAEGPVPMETRLNDVKRRYGKYPQRKWDRCMELKQMFESRAGRPLMEIVNGDGQK